MQCPLTPQTNKSTESPASIPTSQDFSTVRRRSRRPSSFAIRSDLETCIGNDIHATPSNISKRQVLSQQYNHPQPSAALSGDGKFALTESESEDVFTYGVHGSPVKKRSAACRFPPKERNSRHSTLSILRNQGDDLPTTLWIQADARLNKPQHEVFEEESMLYEDSRTSSIRENRKTHLQQETQPPRTRCSTRPRQSGSALRRTADTSISFTASTPTEIPIPTEQKARNFSRPYRKYQITETNTNIQRSFDVVGVTTQTETILPSTTTDHVARQDFSPGVRDDSESCTAVFATASGLEQMLTSDTQQPASIHEKSRASFDSTVFESVGDLRQQLKHSAVVLVRTFFSLFVIGVNMALGLAYLGSHKHPYMLAVLAFMKSKDILSTIVGVGGLIKTSICNRYWPPPQPTGKWILSLICAYAETEEQIMKTVLSIIRGQTLPHKHVLCIIMDGKKRDILSKFASIEATTKLPYMTWIGKRGELVINAGSIEGIPIILIEKVKNVGKKDSLILGHDLFNHPREDMPHSTKLLREALWKDVIPQIIQESDMTSFDFIFCTDADSTIHDAALKKLANALIRDPRTIAACGVLFAEFGTARSEYSPWHLYQQFQYTFGQYVRRQAESVWGRVTCLPGCITMIVVRPEMGPSLSQYAKPVRDANIFHHQVQYLGTDRRLTWSILTHNPKLRTICVLDALSETVVPDSLSHYLSQRRRWASNAYFNDFFYLLGPRQRLITRFIALIDVVRITLVFYRVFNTAWFLHGLIRHFYVEKIIPTLVITKTPALWYLLIVLSYEPLLRRRLGRILLGMCINQIVSPFLSIIVFANVLLNVGNSNWGQTGASTPAQNMTSGTPIVPIEPEPSQSWTPQRLASNVQAAIHGKATENNDATDRKMSTDTTLISEANVNSTPQGSGYSSAVQPDPKTTATTSTPFKTPLRTNHDLGGSPPTILRGLGVEDHTTRVRNDQSLESPIPARSKKMNGRSKKRKD